MNSLRNLTKNHNISILTSIHQPNNEIVLMFDKIYVLAKGGQCLFSGAPNMIRFHMFDNNIIIEDNDVPIEQLLKIASIESQKYFNEMIERTKNKLKYETQNISKNEMKLTFGLQPRNKPFSPSDIWYLMLRTMNVQYIRQWKTLLSQFLFYILFPICVFNMFDDNISKPSGCFNPHTLSNDSCVKDLENNKLLVQNHNFLFFMTIMAQVIQICYATTAYLNDVKIFIHEHDNRKYLMIF